MPTPALDKYILHRVNDAVVVNFTDQSANTVVAQVVSGSGSIAVEVSMDYGWSWWPVTMTQMDGLTDTKLLALGSPAWALVPGVTNARALLVRNESSEPCKVNLRYGRA